MEHAASNTVGEKALHKKTVKARQKASRDHEPEINREYRKACDNCQDLKDILIRCQDDDSGKWKMLCTAGCWQKASGGRIDGSPAAVNYRYSGIWKNRHANVTGKIPKRSSQRYFTKSDFEFGKHYTKNDVVDYQNTSFVCRSSITPTEGHDPMTDHHHWKEADSLN